MRLINAQNYQFQEFWDEDSLEYAILSHRWEDEEVTFQDFQELQGIEDPNNVQMTQVGRKGGFRKIELCCMQARYDKIDYVWIDTCCIDKSSSAELTEAINSMYRWYKHSKVCYAFLADVSYGSVDDASAGSLASSAWFTRGWTLQELVAPRSVIFYDRGWEFLGTKETLSSKISQITSIDEAILAGDDILERSIAQRMSWASKRTTTRIEDVAYSLLGIFDVNMPLLYGEGVKAFLRLQEEIIRSSDDHTIFAWPHQRSDEPGLLAESPAAFQGCGNVQAIGSRKGKSAYSMTNRGLSITLDAVPWNVDTYLVALQCVDERLHKGGKPIDWYRMGMFVRRLAEDDQFIRVREGEVTFVQHESSTWETPINKLTTNRPVRKLEINVRQKVTANALEGFKERIHGFRIKTSDLLERDKHGKDLFTISCHNFDREHAIISTARGRYDTVGLIDISDQKRKIKVIKLGFDLDYNPVCFVAESGGRSEQTHLLNRQGEFNINSDWQWTNEEHAQFKSIYQRSCFDQSAWSTINGKSASQLPQHDGLWAIKGDRVHGINVSLSTYDATPTTLEIRRGEHDGKLIWDVSLHGMKNSFTRSLKPGITTRKGSDADVKNTDDKGGNTRKGSGMRLFGGKEN